MGDRSADGRPLSGVDGRVRRVGGAGLSRA
jgi:hypothetical protein